MEFITLEYQTLSNFMSFKNPLYVKNEVSTLAIKLIKHIISWLNIKNLTIIIVIVMTQGTVRNQNIVSFLRLQKFLKKFQTKILLIERPSVTVKACSTEKIYIRYEPVSFVFLFNKQEWLD